MKFESENQRYSEAQTISMEARRHSPTQKVLNFDCEVWMKSALLEWQLGNLDTALDYLQEATEAFPEFQKFWMMKGQILLQKNETDAARQVYAEALGKFPRNHVLWILASDLESALGRVVKARSLLEKGRVFVPKCHELWHAAIKIEKTAANYDVARALAARALQECPSSGVIWSDCISLEPVHARKSKSIDALKKCDSDPYVLAAAANLLAAENAVEKARMWYDRAVSADADNGDIWALFYLFESRLDGGVGIFLMKNLEELLARYHEADPKHGIVFPSIAKDARNWKKSKKELLELAAAKLACE
jgi:pre-mRNA-processing factor 6